MAAALFLLMVLTVFPAGIERGEFGFSAALADDDDDDDDDRVAPAPRPDHVPDEVIMVNPSPAGLERSRTLGFTPYAPETIAGIGLNITRLRPPPNLDAPAALALLRQELPQETSDLNHLYRPQFCRGGICRLPMPSRSPLLLHANAYSCPGARCYGQKMVGWSDELAACSAGLRIGVIDTGADSAHPALKGRKVTAASFVPPPLPPAPTDHGTAVLALLAGAPESPVPGLLPQAEFFLADVFHSPGPGSSKLTLSVLRGGSAG
jgi:subtilisin family serine protease